MIFLRQVGTQRSDDHGWQRTAGDAPYAGVHLGERLRRLGLDGRGCELCGKAALQTPQLGGSQANGLDLGPGTGLGPDLMAEIAARPEQA
jgi:hypothetical protein